MSTLIDPLRRLFKPVRPVPAGMYHYQAPQDDARNYRLHLRVEQDGGGILLVNASTVLHLNHTATEYAHYFINNQPAQQVARDMSRRYNVDADQAYRDYRALSDQILTLIEMPDLDPVTFLDFDRRAPYSATLSAPYRLDCALTYRLPEGADPSAAPTKLVDRELSTQEWQAVIDRAWKSGIPHIVFTGGEATLREDLISLVAHTEKNGQVSGLLTDGVRLAEPAYLNSLLQTGLDHLMIMLSAENKTVWAALQNALQRDIFVAVHLTLTPDNLAQARQALARLAELQISALSLSTNDPSLNDQLNGLAAQAANLNLSLVWDLPVPYSEMNPVTINIEQPERAQGAGRAWLYVEPDGDVLPTQGSSQLLGNFLKDPWEKIWKSN